MLINAASSLFILFVSVQSVFCGCENSYVTYCKCLGDFKNYKISNWTDVIVDGSNFLCPSSYLGSNNIDDLEEIKLLIFVNQIDGIHPKTFSTIGQTLKYLNFYGNNLTTIKASTFSSFRKLNLLRLVNNKIKTLEACAFEGSKIKHLDLSDNQLEVLSEDAFHDGKIKAISIRNNKLTVIDKKAFNDDLEVLHLDYNNLVNIQSGFLSNVPRLKEFTLSHNRLAHISDFSTLENLKKFDLSFNNMNFIETEEFEDLKQLEHLDLSCNNLESFSLNALKKNKADKVTLLLSYNRLTNLKIPNTAKPMTITLYGNPWNCQCWTTMLSKMVDLGFSRTECDAHLFKSGTVPVCIDQGECKNDPVQNRDDLRRFARIIDRHRNQLSCDLFGEVGPKHVVSFV